MGNRGIKISLFVLLIVLFILIYLVSIFGSNISFYSTEDIIKNRKEKKDLINELKINGIDTVYDIDNNIFYYSLTETREDKKITLKLELPDKYKFKLVKEKTTIVNVNFNKKYEVIIYNDKNYMKTYIQFTNLPLIEIKTESEIYDDFTNATFKYINDSLLDPIVENNIKVKVRGDSSKIFDKKSMKIEVYNKEYTDTKKINLSTFDLSDTFILDANYRDPAKIRNPLSFDLWEQISKDFTDIAVEHEFVEVFINGEYNGLYILFEPVKRQTLRLNKTTEEDTSIIIKADQYEHIIGNDISNISTDTYANYELKYPNDEEYYKIVWENSLGILRDFNTIGKEDEIIKNTFNLESYVDLSLFNSFFDNVDNAFYKNNYFYKNSINDKVFYIQPWDLEYTMGLYYCKYCDKYTIKDIEKCEEISVLALREKTPEINELVIKRYKELRKDIITKENFNKLIDEYKELLKYSAKRDSAKWYEYDIDKEIEEVRDYLMRRIEVYDKYIESYKNEI